MSEYTETRNFDFWSHQEDFFIGRDMQAVYGYVSTITTKNNILGHIKMYVSPDYFLLLFYCFNRYFKNKNGFGSWLEKSLYY